MPLEFVQKSYTRLSELCCTSNIKQEQYTSWFFQEKTVGVYCTSPSQSCTRTIQSSATKERVGRICLSKRVRRWWNRIQAARRRSVLSRQPNSVVDLAGAFPLPR